VGLYRLSRQCELRLLGILRSSPPKIATRHTKIGHLDDAPSPQCLLRWWRCTTRHDSSVLPLWKDDIL
jgi:hypothetical protein